MAIPGLRDTGKRLEHAHEFRFRNPRALVTHLDHHPAIPGSQFDLYSRLLRGMTNGVTHHVLDGRAQQNRIALHLPILDDPQFHAPLPRPGLEVRVVHHVKQQVCQTDAGTLQAHLPGFEPGQGQEIRHQPFQFIGFLADAHQGIRPGGISFRQFQCDAQARQRRT